ncbi:hypothetical protein BpHYR1_021102 [Brachionus plicatilis]|uniref:Uncharacterized protein n=1 Tax=Brachionus plicatilis TaxID=10195 RepID=A0A3M7PE23_BRAPC|nr:hypothetical protein BpHYR1_021102 [Brachionus plicatilis]
MVKCKITNDFTFSDLKKIFIKKMNPQMHKIYFINVGLVLILMKDEINTLRTDEAGLNALEALRNTDYTQSTASDDDDADFLDDHIYLDEFD